MRAVFLRILGFVILIDLFYMGIGRLYLTQSEEHPAAELQISVETDTDTLVGMGESLLKTKGGCLLCHKISEVGNSRGPDLRGVGSRAATRVASMSAEAYLTQSLEEPGAYVVEEFATPGGQSIMPAANKPPADLSPTEMKALVAYLQSLSGEITVVITAEDVAAAEARKTKKPAPASSHPGFALLGAKGCVACHDFSGSTRMVGPPLTHVGERLSAAEIRQSIVDPNAVIAEGYQKDLMLQDFAATLTPNELDQLVSYLSGDVPLSARLAHPGVHLLMLILLFNGGVAWAARRVESMGDVPPPGTAPKRGPLLGRIGAIGVAFGVVAAVYSGIRYQENRRLAARAESTPAATAASEIAVDTTTELGLEGATATAMDGEALYKVTCPACHGQQAEGVPGLGKDITKSEFVMGLSDAELVEFIKQGRAANDPLNTTGVEMPPKGLNAALSDEEILAIVHFIRALGR